MENLRSNLKTRVTESGSFFRQGLKRSLGPGGTKGLIPKRGSTLRPAFVITAVRHAESNVRYGCRHYSEAADDKPLDFIWKYSRIALEKLVKESNSGQ